MSISKELSKNSKNMFKQVLSGLSHMTDINPEAEKDIADEIERIKGGLPVVKKKDVAVKVEKPLENLEKKENEKKKD